MIIIYEKSTELVKFKFDDSTAITLKENYLSVKNSKVPEDNVVIPVDFDDIKIVKNVKDLPNDFIGNKYKYKNKSFEKNLDFIDEITKKGKK